MEPDSSQSSQQLMTDYSQSFLTSVQNHKENAKTRIEECVLAIIDSITARQFPTIIRPRLLTSAKEMRKAANNPNLATKITFGGRSSRSFTMQVYIMSLVYRMIQQNQSSTIRDLFYENMNFFGNQSRVVNALREVSLFLKVPREALCVEASAKGLVAGSISFRNPNGEVIQAMDFRHGMIVPNKLHDLTITTNARCVLFVEKDAIFQRLLDEGIFEVLGSIIMITGKGYPDYQTRRLMSILNRIYQLKVYALVDCDPYGIEIAAVVKWGSYINSNAIGDDMWACDLSVPDLVWLGLLPSEVSSLSLTLNASAELNDRDRKKLESVHARIGLYEEQDQNPWLQEVNILKELGRKTELEALFASSMFTTRVYLPSKLLPVLSQRDNNRYFARSVNRRNGSSVAGSSPRSNISFA
ncbi:Meiotic recombination protein SPO11 [Orchesella cincta]|uniref:DNA topoisomerase (ATP-hydrolyzing) n=1 Tax=Orchesella cincta TaxID=48709 RepID=A0A1D2NBM6_ORCCI|nr:Meiotic recombination protein SPO11 [Orchesella cincta]